MSGFRIQTMVLGMVSTNCYLIYREGEAGAVIVDPADNADAVLGKCRELSLKPEVILLTHGHFDHIGAASKLRERLGAQVWAGEKEEGLLKDPYANLSSQFGQGFGIRADRLLREGEELALLGWKWTVMETPGHTPGSVCYYIPEEEVLISGDTLFCGSFGRTDFPGGSTGALVDSIGKKLMKLPEDTMVYSGHGDPTTIGYEKKYNPIMAYCR